MTMHAVVSGWLLGPHSGANKRLLAILAHAGAHLQADERITVLHRPGFVTPDLPRVDWLPVDIPAGPTWRRTVAEQFRLRPLLEELGATVYDHGFLPPPRVGVPLTLTIHDLRAAHGHTIWPKWFGRSVLRKACRRAQIIITPSEWTRRNLRAIAPDAADRIAVIPNGFSPHSGALGRLPRPKPGNGYVLHVGHLEARKNLPVAIRALAELPAVVAPELWLAGNDAGAGTSLAKLCRELGVADQVHHLGPVDDATLHALYVHARALVMPSVYEGFGLPVLEAMHHGLPVLAADAAALPEVMMGHGTLLPPEDPSAWAAALLETMTESRNFDDNPAMGQRMVESMSATTWELAAQMVVSVWRTVSAGGDSAARATASRS